jgi:hypothetical protein
MKRSTKVILIIFLLLISAVVIIGVDVYLSYRHFEERSGDFDLGSINDVVADNNESVLVTAVLTTPKLGYIPKSVRLDITVRQGGDIYGDPMQFTIKLGESQNLEFNFTLEADEILDIANGFAVVFTVDVLATPIYIGIPLNFVAQEFEQMVISVEA